MVYTFCSRNKWWISYLFPRKSHVYLYLKKMREMIKNFMHRGSDEKL
jgi:hypothetical protein